MANISKVLHSGKKRFLFLINSIIKLYYYYYYFFLHHRSQAFNARAIQVRDIPDGVVNEPVEFESKYTIL